ncbi:MAG: VCBS repeat-containing protein, partial [Planctomycetota bacterium]
MSALAWLAALAAVESLRSQELLWQVHSVSGVEYGDCAKWFGDLNADGFEDLLVAGLDHGAPGVPRILRVLSGKDGAVLAQVLAHPTLSAYVGVGDFNGDGAPDFAYIRTALNGNVVEIWSARPGQLLLTLPGYVTIGAIGAVVCGN